MTLNRADRWLVLGLAAGLLAVLASALQPPDGALDAQVAARVGNAHILESDWAQAVAAVRQDRRSPLTEADEHAILQRLIDEELLVQHALASGLAQSAPRIRAQLVQELMESMRIERRADENTLRSWYQDHQFRYRQEPQWHLRVERADGSPVPLPDALLPQRKLADYLPTDVITALDDWRADADQREIGAYRVTRLDFRPAQLQPFERVQAQVLRDWQREQNERALRQLLTTLRDELGVTVRP